MDQNTNQTFTNGPSNQNGAVNYSANPNGMPNQNGAVNYSVNPNGMPNQNGQANYSTNQNQGDSDKKIMAALSYISILALIPFFTEKNDQWVRFHAVQGMNLLIISLAVFVITFVGAFFAIIPFIGVIIAGLIGLVASLVSLGLFVLSIIGIVNVVKGEAKELPIISKIKIIK